MKRILRCCLLVLLFASTGSCAQNDKNCNQATLVTLNESREIFKNTRANYSDIIKYKIAILNNKSSSDFEKFGKLKDNSDKVDKAVNHIILFIESLKDEAKTHHFDDFNKVMMYDTQLYGTVFFDKENVLAERGEELKEKIQLFHDTISGILNTHQSKLKAYNQAKFDTTMTFRDYEGKEIDYMNYKLQDRTVIGMLSYFERLRLELTTFQFLFMNSIVLN